MTLVSLGSRPFPRGQFGVQANIGEGGEASSHGIAVSPVSSQGELNLSVILLCFQHTSPLIQLLEQGACFCFSGEKVPHLRA